MIAAFTTGFDTGNADLSFDVLLGDRLIYSYHPTIQTMHGSTYGNDIHIIPIPSDSSEVTLRIRGECLDASMFIGFRKAELGSGTEFMHELIRGEIRTV